MHPRCVESLFQRTTVGDVCEYLWTNFQEAQQGITLRRSPIAHHALALLPQRGDGSVQVLLNLLSFEGKLYIGLELTNALYTLHVEYPFHTGLDLAFSLTLHGDAQLPVMQWEAFGMDHLHAVLLKKMEIGRAHV